MASYPVEVRRCQHIKTNGTQCGSPALRGERFCHFHQEWRPRQVQVYTVGYNPPAAFHLPLLEDAGAIQLALTQVTELLLSDAIKPKIASLVLYALQIASSNLKRLKEERPKRPTSVVVDREKVAETPLGETPWSASGEGHDPEAQEEEKPLSAREQRQQQREAEEMQKKKQIEEQKAFLLHLGQHLDDPYTEEMRREGERVLGVSRDDDEPPPGTIQACAEAAGTGGALKSISNFAGLRVAAAPSLAQKDRNGAPFWGKRSGFGAGTSNVTAGRMPALQSTFLSRSSRGQRR